MANSVLRQSAKGQDCNIQIPTACNRNPETTVLCHLGGAGVGLKMPDILAAFGCSSCHDLVDGRTKTILHSNLQIKLMFFMGIIRTIQYWWDAGYIQIAKPDQQKISKYLPRKY